MTIYAQGWERPAAAMVFHYFKENERTALCKLIYRPNPRTVFKDAPKGSCKECRELAKEKK